MKKVLVFVLGGVALLFLFKLMPTHDDWGYLTAPHWGDFWERMLPNRNHWRPFDALFGSALGLHVGLFPYLNHFFIWLAHCLSAYVLYKILGYYQLKSRSVNIALLFYLFSPATLGTVLGIDSLNQAYASFWGITSLYLFLSLRGKKRIIAWIFCALLAIFSKENGIAWLFIPPLFLGISETKFPWKLILKYWGLGFLVLIIYVCLRKGLEIEGVSGISPLNDLESPYYFSIKNKIKDLVSFIGGSFFAIDFISILHKPSRNLVIATLTFLACCPFLYLLFRQIFIQKKEKYIWIFLFASVIAALPHLATHFGPMHAYSSLSLVALLVAFVVDRIENKRNLILCFGLFLASALFVDAHHWHCTYVSSKKGIEMGQKVVDRTTVVPESVLIITVMDEQPRYSSFCVPPREAYRDGHAAQFVYKYEYPKKKVNVYLSQYDTDSITYYIDQHKDYLNCVWINDKDSIEVINLR